MGHVLHEVRRVERQEPVGDGGVQVRDETRYGLDLSWVHVARDEEGSRRQDGQVLPRARVRIMYDGSSPVNTRSISGYT